MTPEMLISVPLVGLLILTLALRAVGVEERRTVGWAFAAHVLGTFAVVFYHEVVFGGGDMIWFAYMGRKMSGLMHADFVKWAPEVTRLVLHRETTIPFDGLFEGSSTGTMSGLSGWLMFLSGDSLMGGCLLVSFFAFYGSVKLYLAAAPYLQPAERKPVVAAALVIPSLVFWSSGILKEAFVVGALGIMCHGAVSIFRGRYLGVFGLAAGAIGVGLLKPYVLFVSVFAFAAAFAAARAKNISLGYKILAVLLAVAGFLAMSKVFPDFAADKIGESVARMQGNFRFTTGGSNIDIGDDEIELVDTSLLPQLKYVPLALINALFRPLLIEARNPVQLVAAIEMTAMIVLGVGLVRRHTLRVVVREVRGQPWLMFCVTFVLLFSTGVGLATKNLGSLSRYRIPMMPMYACALVALRVRLRSSAGATERVPLGRGPRAGRRKERSTPASLAAAEAVRRERVERLRRASRPGSR